MATRLYYSATAAAAVSPAYSASWNRTTDAVRRELRTTPDLSALTLCQHQSTGTKGHTVLATQLVGPPLAPQTISGTVKGYLCAVEEFDSNAGTGAVTIRVLSGDGLTVRGTLLAMTMASDVALVPSGQQPKYAVGSTAAASRNRRLPDAPPQTLTSVSCQDGDRIVVELGTCSYVATTNRFYWHLNGAPSATTDLPEDTTTAGSTTANPWIEFSGTITPQGQGLPWPPGGRIQIHNREAIHRASRR